MTGIQDIPFSVLDLCPIVEGGTVADSLRNTGELARHADALGYTRYWLAEHHNIPGVASSATAVLIGHVAGLTRSIRVGSGGVMLPNHAPLVVAEQFGTLATLYPGRIDLGLGRAPGTDPETAHALRRDLGTTGEEFPQLLAELRAFLGPAQPGQRVQAIPGQGTGVPVWLLGSAGFSARLAGRLGLPFSFARQFSPANTLPALEIYRRSFEPSEVLEKPYAMVGINVVAADSDAEARRLFTSHQQAFLNLVRGRPGRLRPPVDDMGPLWDERERIAVESQLRGSVVGGPQAVREQLEALLEETQADEIMVNSMIFDHAARLRSYTIVAELRGRG
ncbi:MAG TPA: LLM class flavin-dependent oxidoreductase [Azospirillaceae bacterium]|nr:LLM class flavin-dependent oxidoreductase [Azospirillaceae bacterium]